MSKNRAHAVVLSLLAMSSVAMAAGGIHIDASSDANANHSFQRMLTSLDGHKRDELSAAIVQLNKEDDVASRPNGQHPSAARIKDKIGGLTADEIIALAQKSAPAKP